MGQYWTGLIEHDGEYFKVAPDWVKIMEHSWIENPYLIAVYKFIKGNPCKICWAGDYANDAIDAMDEKNSEKFKKALEVFYKSDCKKIEKCEDDFDFSKSGYLINYSKKEYLDMEKYCKLSENDGWVINPLSLLTAVPGDNGLGGGDYFGDPGKELIGYWSLDEISFEDSIPDSFNELEVIFKE